jgi:hypothetical protein
VACVSAPGGGGSLDGAGGEGVQSEADGSAPGWVGGGGGSYARLHTILMAVVDGLRQYESCLHSDNCCCSTAPAGDQVYCAQL